MNGKASIAVLQMILLNMKFGSTVKDLKLHLPAVVKLRSDVVLECSFKLENESLYSIKLYKGREEFLHFVPAFSPPYKVFATKGVSASWTNLTLGSTQLYYKGASPFQYNVDTKNIIVNQFGSGSLSVILSSVSLFTAGLFGCEVSADFPEYDTDIKRKHLHVFVSPSSRPHVTGLQNHYKPGDVLNITCISSDSFPAANISWFINGNKASSSSVRKTDVTTEKSGLLSSYSQLSLLATDKLIIKCVASILTSFWQSTDQVVTLLEPPMSPVLTDRKDKAVSVTSKTARERYLALWILVIFQSMVLVFNTD